MIVLKNIETYFKSHIAFGSAVHMLIGVGLGILVTYPLVGNHPLRWGVLFLTLGLVGHIFPLFLKKGKGR